MLSVWFAATMLALESGDVIALRLQKFSACDEGALDEAHFTVVEKATVLAETGVDLFRGESLATIIGKLRERAAANVARLTR